MKKFFPVIFIILILSGLVIFNSFPGILNKFFTSERKNPTQTENQQGKGVVLETAPLNIEYMRAQKYPGSEIIIEQTLTPGLNYNRYLASYKSDGLNIHALLTVPRGDLPLGGWPVIIFNHGYIPPKQYVTTERYVTYVDAFAGAGYVVFKPDYRGNGLSEGQAQGSYYSPGYTIDVLNALASIKKLRDPSASSGQFVVDTNRIGMWGHSMGGNITLRSLVISPDIKAAVVWGGVVGTYDDLMNNWQRRVTYSPPPDELANRNNNRADLITRYGTPEKNPAFWNLLDPNFNLRYIKAPIQLHAGLLDEEVPWQFSQGLDQRLKQAGKSVEFYTYPGADHNISSPNFEIAMKRSVDFFNKYLK